MKVEYKEGALGSKTVLKNVHIFSLSSIHVSVVKHVVKSKHVVSVYQTKVSVMKPQFDPARAFMMTLRAPQGSLDTIACVRAVGEVCVQLDTLDFWGSVQRVPPLLRLAIVGGARTGGYRR